MLTYQRQKEILEILKQNKTATVEYLSKKLYASGATIRRDLAEMEKEKILIRVRGGAVLNNNTTQDIPFLFRENDNKDKKQIIGELALQFINDGDCIFMDSGSTSVTLSKMLEKYKNLYVVTNGLKVIQSLSQNPNIKIFCTGGLLSDNSTTMVGEHTKSFVQNYNTDILFFSCAALSLDGFLTDATEQNCIIKQYMIKSSAKRVLLCDSTKIGKKLFCTIDTIENIDYIITEKMPPKQLTDKYPDKFIFPE